MEIKSGEEVGSENPVRLFELSGAVVSSIMGQVEKEVWELPGPILQGILPLLNIYYLERIEETAVKKGLSTEPIWCKLWFDIMKTRPSRLENIKCWRKKFLETFFSNNTCQMLGNLLSSWVALEKLILTLNGLGLGIFSILSGLRILSQCNDYCLRVVRISDMFAHVPCMNLVHSLLSAVPLLRMLLVSFDLKTAAEWNRLEEDMGSSSSVEKIPETYLEQLEIRFPREPLQTSLLAPVLKASGSLKSFSLDSVAISYPQEVGLLLQALKEYNPNLKKLNFHDVNLSEHSKEVLLILQSPILQEVSFSFCRLFENCTAELLTEMITAMKKNSSLTTLKLPGNRLGNHRLIALADIFAGDSSSSISHLDISSNCIKPDGLLEFTKKLESYTAECRECIKLTKLCLYQNWLDQDAATAQEALSRLKAICNVVSDAWDSSQAFADYISVM
ncbi:leucine-rich repeat-containing protein 41 [Crotalus adamanteus]|uniref:Leucine-rich repeat-containing protein 41 n=1 Tax=Crotalus adamanteus TaxID=8729 RepID=A0AAW1BS87_CROAD